jgi:hypothetical protein
MATIMPTIRNKRRGAEMPQVRKGPRLWLDKGRGCWVIREDNRFVRTRYREHQIDLAKVALNRFIRTRPWRLERTIYFVTCDAPDFPVKIGMSGNVEERLRDIRTSLPFEPVLLASFEGTSKDERAAHNRFAELRIKGEWFRRSPELMAYIAELSVPSACLQAETVCELEDVTL